MSKAYRNQLSWEQPATDQADMGQGQRNVTGHNGMGNAARQEQMKASAPPPIWQDFRYRSTNFYLLDGNLAGQITRAFCDEKLGLKDGTDLTDPERLFVAATRMKALGLSDTKIEGAINTLFFMTCENCGQWGSIKAVTIADSNVTVEFRVDLGVQPAPMNFPRPVAFHGRDTNARGNRVDKFQSDGEPIFAQDTWLDRNATQILSGFLADPRGLQFATMDPTTRENLPAFKLAFFEFKKGISHLYLTHATHVVEQNARANQAAGDSNAQIRDQAVDDALNYSNVYAYATAHTTLEIQDEAVVQKALQALGLDTDVDTDVQDQRLSQQP